MTLSGIDFEALNPDDLIDYIVCKHHSYTKEAVKLISVKLKSLEDNKDINPRLLGDLLYTFAKFKDDVEQHMRKEEFILFPFIKKLTAMKRGELKDDSFQVQLVESPLRILQKEHVNLTGILSELRESTHDYTPGTETSATLKLCYAEMYALEQDIHRHIYLENNILFPKVIKIEKSLKKTAEPVE